MSLVVPDTVLVIDRGVAAVRVLRALQGRGIKAVSVHTDLDATALHTTLADESVLLGPTTASYGDVLKLVEAARQAGAQAVHPVTVELAGLEDAVLAAQLEWLGGTLHVPVELAVGDGVVEARCTEQSFPLPPVASRSAEVVTGLDLTCATLTGQAEGVARDGVAVSVDILAATLAPVTAVHLPSGDDVWVDLAVAPGSRPVDPLLAVLTAWGPDRDSAYDRACEAWDHLDIEGPVVPRPEALGGPS
ncbi:MAG: acetyl/propionyl-CoA carboxylase subuit alpha [Frankiales bacterium]|nr:acetyl/propionyl-CoA carboxylase subuit alpha [Frankiales bacterium]